MIKKFASYRFILIPVFLGFLLAALIIPWIMINFLGKFSYSPLDIVIGIFSKSQNVINLFDLMSDFNDSYFAFIFSIFIYVISFVSIGIIFPLLKKHRLKILLIAGMLAIVSGLFWIYSIESYKIHFIQNAISAGGIIGEEFKGQESIIINTIFIMRFGHYISIIGGLIAIFAYLWR